jgi:hypothetical protein
MTVIGVLAVGDGSAAVAAVGEAAAIGDGRRAGKVLGHGLRRAAIRKIPPATASTTSGLILRRFPTLWTRSSSAKRPGYGVSTSSGYEPERRSLVGRTGSSHESTSVALPCASLGDQ